MKVTYRGVGIELQELPNGKYARPNVAQFTKSGRGCTWLDDCRVPVDGFDKDMHRERNNGAKEGLYELGIDKHDTTIPPNYSGRFPANLLCSDDVLNDGVDRKSPKPYVRGADASGGILGKPKPEGMMMPGIGDSGSYSRYFDLDAWAKTFPFLITPKASKREKNEGLEALPQMGRPLGISQWEGQTNGSGKTMGPSKPQSNHHPTVKPLKLMSYLITLGSRPGDVVLDPFAGSGTTCLAAKQLGRNYVCIEKEPEYAEIAEARLKVIQPSLL